MVRTKRTTKKTQSGNGAGAGTKLRLAAQVGWQYQDGAGGMLFHPRSGSIYKLNPVTAWILQRLLDGAEAAEVPASMVERYEVDRETAEKDLAALVLDLRSQGLCEPVDQA